MERAWIENNLPVVGEELILLSDATIGTFSIQVDDFLEIFGDVEPTYAALVNADDGRGFVVYFDDWLARGILS